MKSIISFFILVFYITTVNALHFEFTGNQLNVTGSFELGKQNIHSRNNEEIISLSIPNCGTSAVWGKADLPVYSKLVSLPNEGNYVLQDIYYDYNEISLDKRICPLGFEEEINYNEEFYSTDKWFPKELTSICKPVIMGGNRFCQISISAVQYNPAISKLRILKNINAVFKIDISQKTNPIIKNSDKNSAGFAKFAKKNIIGTQNNRSEFNRNYLFISPEACVSVLDPLVKWKEKLGFEVEIATLSETGNTSEEIKSYLQNAYNTWENPLENVILFGDVTGSFTVPSFYTEGGPFSPWDVTDHPYTLLEGDDYFPDVFIGRVSFLSLMELITIINKIISYERDPYISQDWFKHALMVGYVDAPNDYFSPYETLMEVRNKLLNFNYSQVDTFIAPYYTSPLQLADWINTQGYTFINYRGTGGADYWGGSWGGGVGELFTGENVENLSNGYMMPLVTSIVCGGGNFAYSGDASCFGEKWLKVGSPTIPQGAIGFIGPSEIDTKTQFNNTIDMGIYQGITQEGITSCGEILLRGKIALYNNYPNLLELGQPCYNVPFYFYVYNLLGDPGLHIWTDTPQQIEMSFADSISVLDNFLQVNIENNNEKSDFIIAITNDDSLVTTSITDETGKANILSDFLAGTYIVTASKYGFIPQSDTLIVAENNILALNEFSFSEDIIPAAELSLFTNVINYQSTELDDVTFSLNCEDEYIEILNESVFLDSIPSHGSADLIFGMQIGEEWMNEFEYELFLEAANSEISEEFLIPINVNSADLAFKDLYPQLPDSFLAIGAQSNFKIELKNNGSRDSEPFSAVLVSQDLPVQVTDSISTFGNIAVNDSVFSEEEYSIVTSDSLIAGEFVDLSLQIFQDSVFVQSINFSARVGQVDESSPTFGNGGYIAIENTDIGNFTPPEYEWIEIDPNYGGNGNLIEGTYITSDGWISTIQFPRSFSYYDRFYAQMSVCSNGYISMGETDQVFFRNKIIPSGVGSQAMIAPFWDNLADGEVYSFYDSDANRLIIEWSRFKNVYDPETEETFQVIFQYADTESGASIFDDRIIFQYKDFGDVDQNENYSTTGIENYTQTRGLLMNFSDTPSPTAHELHSDTAILFKRQNVSNFPLLVCDPEEISITLPPNKSVQSQVSIQNCSENTEIEFEVSLSHFRKNDGRTDFAYDRNLENDTIVAANSAGYVAFIEQNFNFYLFHDATSEPIVGVSLDFPEAVDVLDATSLDSLTYNGETGMGATVSWGNGEEMLLDSGVSPFGVTAIVDTSMNLPIDIIWEIQGEGLGSAPHTKFGVATILPAEGSYLWITHPDLGDQMVYGLTDSITWVDWGEEISPINLEISFNGNDNWEMLAEAIINDHNYYFNVPEPLSDECFVRITDQEGEVLDNSARFSINALNITYPSANSTLQYNTSDSVKWINCGGIETVNVDLSDDGGYTWENLAEDVPNDGKYEFVVPGSISDNCKIRLTDFDGSVYNTSSGFFSITDSPVNWLTTECNAGVVSAGETNTFDCTISSQNLENGEYSAFIKIKSEIGLILRIPVSLKVMNDPLPQEDFLGQNTPNPIYEWTSIPFRLNQQAQTEPIRLKIYNVKGQLVRTLNYTSSLKQGEEDNYFLWDTTDSWGNEVSTGVYFYRLTVGSNIIETKKCLIIR